MVDIAGIFKKSSHLEKNLPQILGTIFVYFFPKIRSKCGSSRPDAPIQTPYGLSFNDRAACDR
jgi:hypothetical protein